MMNGYNNKHKLWPPLLKALFLYLMEIVLLIYFDTASTKAKEAQALLLMKSIIFSCKYSI